MRLNSIRPGDRLTCMSNHDADKPQGHARFATTRWSLVVAAGRSSAPEARAALETLCQWYWTPLYEFARRRGSPSADAADLTQDFFVALLEKDFLRTADQERGRFRSFLLTAFKRFLMNEHDRATALKRGGGVRVITINADEAESRVCLEPADHRTPEILFERRWAITLLDRVLGQLAQEMSDKGRSQLFECCRGCLTGVGLDEHYASIASQCGVTEAAVKVAVHRLRARYRELLIEEVRQTVASEAEVVDELRALMRAVMD